MGEDAHGQYLTNIQGENALEKYLTNIQGEDAHGVVLLDLPA